MNAGHFGIWADGLDLVYYLRDANVMRYRVRTDVHEAFANSGTLADGTVSSFMFVGGKANLLTQDICGNVWVGDDTSDGVGNGTGRVWHWHHEEIPSPQIHRVAGIKSRRIRCVADSRFGYGQGTS